MQLEHYNGLHDSLAILNELRTILLTMRYQIPPGKGEETRDFSTETTIPENRRARRPPIDLRITRTRSQG